MKYHPWNIFTVVSYTNKQTKMAAEVLYIIFVNMKSSINPSIHSSVTALKLCGTCMLGCLF